MPRETPPIKQIIRPLSGVSDSGLIPAASPGIDFAYSDTFTREPPILPMIYLLYLILAVSLLAAFTGNLMILIAAFRQHVLWGLAILILPFAQLIFLFRYWEESKRGFIIALFGGVIAAGCIFSLPRPANLQLADWQKAIGDTGTPQKKIDNLTQEIETHREAIIRVEAEYNQAKTTLSQQYQEVTAKRQALNTADPAAVNQFNQEAAVYHQTNDRVKQLTQTLATARKELDDLLERRSKQQAVAAPVRKDVLIYTTTSCPACKLAKAYLVARGVSFQEQNVNTSPSAAAEFRNRGGNAVPLIFIGDRRIEGFDKAALDQAFQ